MTEERDESPYKLAVGLGLGTLVGVLVSAIARLLRPSKPETMAERLESQDLPDAGEVYPAEIGQAPANPGTPVTPDERPSTRWSMGTKYLVTVLLLLAMLGILYISSSSLSTIIFAALLSFIIHPIIRFFQRRFKMRRGGATAVTYLLVIALIILVPVLIIPEIVEAVQFVVGIDYLALLESASEWLIQQARAVSVLPIIGSSLSSSLRELAEIVAGIASDDPQAASDVMDVSIQDIGGRVAQTATFLVNIFGPLISIGTSVVFTILISLHLSLSIDWLRESAIKLIPPAYEVEITDLFRKILTVWQSFLRGQLSLMVVVGVLVWIGNIFLGTPQALLLGVLAGLLEVIPSLGPVLATIPAVILALLFGSANLGVENWVFVLIIIAFYILVQALENQVLVPYILGDAVDLPPLVVIIGVVVGGSAFGLLGVFLATPVISSGREIFMYLYDKILEPPPEPEIDDEQPSLMESLRAFAARLPRPSRARRRKALPDGEPEEKPPMPAGD